MAVPVVASVATKVGTSGTATTVVVDKPTGTAEGDLLVAQILGGSNNDITGPAGWTELHDTPQTSAPVCRQAIFRKVAGASEGTTYTFSYATGSGWLNGAIARVTGVHATTPIDASDQVATAQSTTHTTPTITTNGVDRLVLSFFGIEATGAGTWSSAGATEQWDTGDSNEDNYAGYSETKATAGTISRTGTWSAAAVPGVAGIVAVSPPASGSLVIPRRSRRTALLRM